MLHLFTILTLGIGIMTGMSVLALGSIAWRNFRLKFIGVIISTVAAGGFLLIHLTNNSMQMCANLTLFTEYELLSIIRNIAFIIFHVSTGRDAINHRRTHA